MPNTKGAKKRLRQSFVRRDRNRAQKTRFRQSLRRFREAVAANNLDEAKQLFVATTRLLDKAAAKGVIHRNKASRLKSRMSHLLVSQRPDRSLEERAFVQRNEQNALVEKANALLAGKLSWTSS